MGEGQWLNIPPQMEPLDGYDGVFHIQAPKVSNMIVGWKVK
jgi:hypothetical protein